MRNKGFTLVELLAVIVILAIILAIAIPSITNVVNSSRLSSFAVSSKMLERAAKTYLSVNNISVASGTTSYILYSDMKSSGYINKVVDPQSNTECTHSGVYVTNNGSNYTYKGALVCDNYMDIDAYNLVTNYDFSDGTNGWASYSASTLSVSSNTMTSTGTGVSQYVVIGKSGNIIGSYTSHKIYLKTTVRVTNSNCSNLYPQIIENNGATYVTQKNLNTLNPTQNQWYVKSGVLTLDASGFDRIQYAVGHAYADAATANGKVMQIDGTYGVYVFDLTAIYGAGNEPTASQMDNIMTNMGK